MNAPRISTIGSDIAGDEGAPVGSRPWCIARRIVLRQLLDRHKIDHEALRYNLDEFVNAKGWLNLADSSGRPFRTYSEFCKSRQPHGLGREQSDIDQLVKEAKSSQAKAVDPDVIVQPNGRPIKGSEYLPLPKGSTSAARIIGRLKRDAPEVAEALGRGEYRSARAAGIAAGIVRVTAPIDAAKKAYGKLDAAQRQEFKTWIKQQTH